MTQLVGQTVIAKNESNASIHDPEKAKALGFRGSAVAGIFHMDCFAPLLLELYGESWWWHGGLSLYFQNVVVSGEPVQAVVETPKMHRGMTRVFARRADDHNIVVCEGTASVHDHKQHDLHTRDLRLTDSSKLRLLRGIKPGDVIGEKTFTIDGRTQAKMLASGGINQDMRFYHSDKPFGAPIATPSQAASLMLRIHNAGSGNGLGHLQPDSDKAAAMYGACELVYESGPIFVDRPYRVRGVVLGTGESPKTEYVWWNATAHDEKGSLVARVRHLLRFIKTGSELYPELKAPA